MENINPKVAFKEALPEFCDVTVRYSNDGQPLSPIQAEAIASSMDQELRVQRAGSMANFYSGIRQETNREIGYTGITAAFNAVYLAQAEQETARAAQLAGEQHGVFPVTRILKPRHN